MLNREIYQLDPVENQLANNGVAKVKDDLSDQALKVLRYELKHLFVMVNMKMEWKEY